MKKRFLSILITVCMLFTLLPTAAMAAEQDFVVENGVLTHYNGSGGSVTVPSTVTAIGARAFYSCTSLTGVTIPNSVTTIGEEAFFDCVALTGVTIPGSVTKIGDGAFAFCRNLTSVTIPNSVTELGGRAFYECTSLTGVIIPNSVTKIGDRAFAFCTSLPSVTIPNAVTELGDRAFAYCDNLTAIHYEGTQEQWAAINATDYQDKMRFSSSAPTPPSAWAAELVNEAIAAVVLSQQVCLWLTLSPALPTALLLPPPSTPASRASSPP